MIDEPRILDPTGAAYNRPIEQMPEAQPRRGWFARVIDGRDEGLSSFFYHRADNPATQYPVGWFVDECDGSGYPYWPGYGGPNRTRDSEGNYIPTIMRLSSFNAGWWPVTDGVIAYVPPEAHLTPNYQGSGYPCYFGGIIGDTTCWMILDGTKAAFPATNIDGVSGSFVVRPGFVNEYTVPNLKVFAAIWDSTRSDLLDMYPKLSSGVYVPIARMQGVGWIAMLPFLPLPYSAGPWTNYNKVYYRNDVTDVGLWAKDTDT